MIPASNEGYSAIVKLLLGAGADPRLKQHAGKTALMLASETGHQEIVDVLRNAALED